MPTICITHPLTASLRTDIDTAVAQLTHAGITVHGTPGKTVTHLPITPSPIATKDLTHTGWLFTSQHGVRGLFNALTQQNIQLPLPNPQQVLAVGPQTYSQLNFKGWQTLHAPDGMGESKALANTLHHMAETNKDTTPAHWVWPCGTHRHDDWLADVTYEQTGLTIHPWVVYTAHPIATLPTAQHQHLTQADALLVTSPGHLEGLLAQQAPIPPQLIAIGPTTAKSILALTGKPSAGIAPQPTWAAMAATCINLLAKPRAHTPQ